MIGIGVGEVREVAQYAIRILRLPPLGVVVEENGTVPRRTVKESSSSDSDIRLHDSGENADRIEPLNALLIPPRESYAAGDHRSGSKDVDGIGDDKSCRLIGKNKSAIGSRGDTVVSPVPKFQRRESGIHGAVRIESANDHETIPPTEEPKFSAPGGDGLLDRPGPQGIEFEGGACQVTVGKIEGDEAIVVGEDDESVVLKKLGEG